MKGTVTVTISKVFKYDLAEGEFDEDTLTGNLQAAGVEGTAKPQEIKEAVLASLSDDMSNELEEISSEDCTVEVSEDAEVEVPGEEDAA